MKADHSSFNHMIMHSNLIKELCTPLFTSLGVTNFIYNEFRENGELIVLNSDADFLHDKKESHFIERLPAVILNDFDKPGLYIQDAIHDNCVSRYHDDEDYQSLAKHYNYAHLLRYFSHERAK